MSPLITQFWETFKKSDKREASVLPTEIYHFCDNEKDANVLGDLVLRGVKQATTALLLSCEFEKISLPQVGELNIITNWQGEPLCVIEITDVKTQAFRDVDADYAFKEGEGDRSLAYWCDAHKDFFTRECESMQMQFDESLLVVCIGLRCVYPRPLA